MHSIYQTLLSIKQWARILGLHPWYLSQIGDNVPKWAYSDMFTKCLDVTFEYTWQAERLSREMVASAIRWAEERFMDYAGYPPAPLYIESEVLHLSKRYLRPIPNGFNQYCCDDKPGALTYPRYGYIQGVGKQILTLIQPNVGVVFSDVDGDGIFDTFTASAVMVGQTGLQVSEVAVFYPASSIHNAELAEWEIRPVKVTIDDTDPDNPIVTVSGAIYQLVQPDLVITPGPERLDASDLLIYIPAIDLYRRTVDEDQQGLLKYNSQCASSAYNACYTIDDSHLGSVIAHRRSTTGTIESLWLDNCATQDPTEATINYVAGYPRQQNGDMDERHAKLIAILSASFLECKPCGCACNGNDNLLDTWSQPPSFSSGRSRIPLVGGEYLSYSFGESRGAIEAFRMAQNMRLMRSFAI